MTYSFSSYNILVFTLESSLSSKLNSEAGSIRLNDSGPKDQTRIRPDPNPAASCDESSLKLQHVTPPLRIARVDSPA